MGPSSPRLPLSEIRTCYPWAGLCRSERPEPPYGVNLIEWKKLFDDRDCYDDKDALTWQAEESFERCDKMAFDQMLENPFVRLCQKVARENCFPAEIRIFAVSMTQVLDRAPIQTHSDDELR